MFLYELALGDRGDTFLQAFGAVPAEIASGRDLGPAAPLGNVYLTLVTSMFLHGGFLHIASNMIYLWVFGDNVEDRSGMSGTSSFTCAAGWWPGWPRSPLTPVRRPRASERVAQSPASSGPT